MKTAWVRLSALMVVCALLAACSGGFPPEFPAADFSLKSPLTNSEVNLSSVKGRPLIIYWFTSW